MRRLVDGLSYTTFSGSRPFQDVDLGGEVTRAVFFRTTWFVIALWWVLSANPSFAQQEEGKVSTILIQIGVALVIAGFGWLVSRAFGVWDSKSQELARRIDRLEELLRSTREDGVRRAEVETQMQNFRTEQATWRAEFRQELVNMRDEVRAVHADMGEIKSLLKKLGDTHG